MSDDFIKTFSQFETRLKFFLDKFEELEKGITKKEEENRRLISEIDKMRKRAEELERKIEVLNMAKSMSSPGGETHDARIKINRLVREIDSCIALLNK